MINQPSNEKMHTHADPDEYFKQMAGSSGTRNNRKEFNFTQTIEAESSKKRHNSVAKTHNQTNYI